MNTKGIVVLNKSWVKDKYLSEQMIFLINFFIMGLLLLTIFRLVLALMYFERITMEGGLKSIFLGGLRIDVSTLSQIIVLPCLLLTLLKVTKFKGQYLRRIIGIWCWFFMMFLVLMEMVTPTFITEYDTRPNRLFIEYLNSPSEVIGMLMSGYWIQVIMVLIVVSIAAKLTKSWLKPGYSSFSEFSLSSFILMIGVLMLLVIGIRSGMQHRPINPAMVAFSNDRMINTLPLNSSYSLMYAIYQLKNEDSLTEHYGSLNPNDMIAIIKDQMSKEAHFIDDSIPTLHQQKPYTIANGKNLIIVVEESLGAQFVGSLGGKPLTPNIDKWKSKSWFFNRLYATGTRSARGLEAITTGFPPSPARSVLKLPKAQSGFYTLANTLSDAGYESSFIYGGESHFDNMKGFFLNNGFKKVIDQNDYINPDFVGNWGVSDEDLFSNALNYLNTNSSKPKFSLIFTSSNHTPFEFPDNKIELYDSNKQTVNNAVKYADYALGKFLDNLERAGLLANSVVLVIADHDARVMGENLVPVERFHIPGFIISEGIAPKEDNKIVSQVDMGPTLLSLLGIDTPTPMIGQDLTQVSEDYRGRAIMQYGNNQAFIKDNQCLILLPDKAPQSYEFINGHLGGQIDTDLFEIALAHAQFSSWAYNNEKYSLVQK